jgi:hypothetical protein
VANLEITGQAKPRRFRFRQLSGAFGKHMRSAERPIRTYRLRREFFSS